MKVNLDPNDKKSCDSTSSITDSERAGTSTDVEGLHEPRHGKVHSEEESRLSDGSRLSPSDSVDRALRGLEAGYITFAFGQALQFYGEGRLSGPDGELFRNALYRDVPRICASYNEKFPDFWLYDAEVNLSIGGKYRRNIWGHATVEIIPSNEPEGVRFVGIDFRNKRPDDENWGKMEVLEGCHATKTSRDAETPTTYEGKTLDMQVVHRGEG